MTEFTWKWIRECFLQAVGWRPKIEVELKKNRVISLSTETVASAFACFGVRRPNLWAPLPRLIQKMWGGGPSSFLTGTFGDSDAGGPGGKL